MFVLPPPPRYPTVATIGPVPETNNILEHPKGPEHQFTAGEGTYVLRDELLVATPPPHPSEAPIVNSNPLATSIAAPTTGTKISIAILTPRYSAQQRYVRSETPNSFASSSSNGKSQVEEPDGYGGIPEVSISVANGNGNGSGNGNSEQQAPIFGQNNPALTALHGKEVKDPLKKRKPKNNIIKSNSSFVSRVIPHEGVAKRLQDHSPAGLFAFVNVNRALQWLDLSSPTKEDNLTKILFTKAHALCHSVNEITKSSTHLDLVIGFSTGDIIWYEPMSQKYARLNKNGVINTPAVSDIQWMPNSENLFLAAHHDGTLVVYDKEKDDAPFIPDIPATPLDHSHQRPQMQIRKSVQSTTQKTNPVAFWKVSNSKINAFAFSPDGRHLAVASEEGSLRIIDLHKERLLDQFNSYYGGLMCVCWSPDGRYILTGGQDDLVSIWSLADGALVARCQGHNSWVTSVAFDPWRCDERNYRFGSVGEDCRLLLWDFSVGMLHRPKAASVRQRASVSSALPGSGKMREESCSASMLRSTSNFSKPDWEAHVEGEGDVLHPVEPRARTAILPPVMAKAIDEHPLSWLGFEEDCIMTACRNGHILTFDRPMETSAESDTLPSSSGSHL